MAALLRTLRSRGNSIFPNILAGVKVSNQTVVPGPSILLYKKNSSYASNYSPQNARFKASEKVLSLDQLLYQLDMDVRRTGRVTKTDVMKIFESVKATGSSNSTQNLLLIRCCGSVLAEVHPNDRSVIIDDVWKVFQEKNVTLDVSHYNALLKIRLENQYKFSSSEFLEEMEKKNLTPNRVTYQRLIEKHCHEGDIEGAREILQTMKDKDMPINELVFNSLITGHFKAKDSDGAQNMIEIMRNAKLEPSSDTYKNLLCGFAEQGDIGSIRNLFMELEKLQMSLNHNDYFSVIHSLVQYGYEAHVDEILNKCPKGLGYNQDSINKILELLNHGFDDIAYKLLLAMPHSTVEGVAHQSNGMFFLKHLIHLARPADQIYSCCLKLQEDGINTMCLSKAADAAFYFRYIDLGVKLVEKMIEDGFEGRAHLFWPALADARKNKDSDAVFKILSKMTELNININFDTYLDYIIPALDQHDSLTVIQKLKENITTSVTSLTNPLITYLLNKKRLNDAVDVVSMYPTSLNGFNIIRPLVHFTSDSSNFDHIMKILARVRDFPSFKTESKEKSDWCGMFLLEACQQNNLDTNVLESLISTMLSANMFISQRSLEMIHSQLKNDIPSKISELLEQLVTDKEVEVVYDDLSTSIAHPKDMNVDELEVHYIELKGKNMNIKGLLRKLLIQHCKLKNIERVTELLDEANKLEYELPSAVMATLIDLFCYHNKVDKAMEYKKLLDERDPFFPLDDFKVIDYARLLVVNENVDEAIKVLNSHKDKNLVRGGSTTLQRNIWRLLNVSAEKGDVEVTEELFNLVQSCNFCTVNNLMLGPLVKAYLFRDDLEGAIKKFEECCIQFKSTPWKNELFVKLINNEDTVNIKKIMDLSTDIHGEMNILYDLAFAFNECGKLSQAKKILETPGLRAKLTRLDPACQRYLQLNMVVELENLLTVTKDLFGIDRDRMYFYLLRAYCKEEDVDKALSVWTSMQEENVQPSTQTLQYLANFLKKYNKAVPFIVPEDTGSYGSLKTYNNTLLDSLKNNDLDRAMDTKRIMEVEGHKLSPSIASQLLKGLMSHSRINDARLLVHEMLANNFYPFPRVFKIFTSHFSKIGDVEFLEKLKPQLPNVLIKSSAYSSAIGKAYINSGRHLEFLESLEVKDPVLIDELPLSGILHLLDKHPDTEEKVLEFVKHVATENEFYKPLNMVWMYYFRNQEYEKADEILNSYPQMKNGLLVLSIVDKVKDTGNEEMGRKLLETIKDVDLSRQQQVPPISGLIIALIKNDKTDEALAEFNGAIKQGFEVSDFTISVLQALKSALQKEGKPIEFNFPAKIWNRQSRPQNKRTSSHSESPDSSDSSDDDK